MHVASIVIASNWMIYKYIVENMHPSVIGPQGTWINNYMGETTQFSFITEVHLAPIVSLPWFGRK